MLPGQLWQNENPMFASLQVSLVLLLIIFFGCLLLAFLPYEIAIEESRDEEEVDHFPEEFQRRASHTASQANTGAATTSAV